MLTKTSAEDLPCVYDSKYAEPAYPLHRLGEELSTSVRSCFSLSIIVELSRLTNLDNSSEKTRTVEMTWMRQRSKEKMVHLFPSLGRDLAYLFILRAAQEIATLRKEAQAFTLVRKALRNSQTSTNGKMNGNSHASGSADAARLAFDKVSRFLHQWPIN